MAGALHPGLRGADAARGGRRTGRLHRAVDALLPEQAGAAEPCAGGAGPALGRPAAARRPRGRQPAAARRAARLPRLRAALLDVLPLDGDSAAGNRIWVGSWDHALADPELAAAHAGRYARSRVALTEFVTDAQRLGELPAHADPAEVAAGAQAFVLGLVVQALFAPEEFPAERQTALLDAYLAGLAD